MILAYAALFSACAEGLPAAAKAPPAAFFCFYGAVLDKGRYRAVVIF
jgi:hypothetical protein